MNELAVVVGERYWQREKLRSLWAPRRLVHHPK